MMYNRNGILEEDEVTSTTRLCHGKEGLSGPQGATGPNGLPGIDSLVNTTIIEHGNESCANGGILIDTGLDLKQWYLRQGRDSKFRICL